MARRCAICGKGPAAGYSLSHSHVRSHRRFLPNLQRVRVMIGGVSRRVNVCTTCLKSRRAVRAVKASAARAV
ncbi:MAG: 50S ribosomal protein L28 [Armatimonadetes bacterium]|nr:50S ribosomal protein L28 [Armatimonadota bacterium]